MQMSLLSRVNRLQFHWHVNENAMLNRVSGCFRFLVPQCVLQSRATQSCVALPHQATYMQTGASNIYIAHVKKLRATNKMTTSTSRLSIITSI